MNRPLPTGAQAAIREQQRRARRGGRLLGGIVAVGLLVALLSFGHLLLALRSWITPQDLSLVLRMIGVLLLVLIPTAGIYSLVSQFAFWEGWITGLPEPSRLFNGSPPAPTGRNAHFVVYLDGIHQHRRDHPPRIQTFLQLLEQALGPRTQLLQTIEPYTVLPVGLADDAGSSWFWRRLLNLQEQHPSGLVQVLAAVLVQANNIIKVGISSDRRYGPILNYELALKVAERLAEAGFHPSRGAPITLLGYSGGGEMAMGMADFLSRICHCPVGIITFCGVFSGNQELSRVARITTVVGSRDPLEVIGRFAYPGRSPLLPLTRWNRALRSGAVRRSLIPGMTHNGNQGPFSERHRQKVIGAIVAAVQGREASV